METQKTEIRKMTSVDINDMPWGVEMDALVTEKIFPKKITTAWGGDKYFIARVEGSTQYLSKHYPPFSTDISSALEMEAELLKMAGHIQVGYVSRLYEILNIPFSKLLTTEESLKLIRATPEQRCRAALKAVMNIY